MLTSVVMPLISTLAQKMLSTTAPGIVPQNATTQNTALSSGTLTALLANTRPHWCLYPTRFTHC